MARTFIITGGNSGLGFQTAKNIALENPENNVVIASHNREKSKIAVEKIIAETQNSNIQSITLDLASLASVRNFYREFSEKFASPLIPSQGGNILNGLVCNAISGGGEPTADGFNMTFGTGHLGHFLLTNLLLKNMAENGRIMFVSSDQHNPPRLIAKLNYTDALDFAYSRKQNHNERYSFTKLCNIYCAYHLSEKIRCETDKNICVNAFNPGFMADTGLAKPKNATERILQKISPLLARLMGTLSSAEISGKILANYILNTEYENITGKYFDRKTEVKSSELSYSKANALNLWERSVELVKLAQDETVF